MDSWILSIFSLLQVELFWGQLFSCFSEICSCLKLLYFSRLIGDLFLSEDFCIVFTTVPEVKQVFVATRLKVCWNLAFSFLFFCRPFKQRFRAIFPYGTSIAEARWWVFCRIVWASSMSCFDLFCIFERFYDFDRGW